MQRWQTWLVVVGVGTIAALAAADALRGDGNPAAAPPPGTTTTTEPRPPTLTGTLRELAVTGFVLWSDEECRLHSLVLPELRDFVVRKEGTLDPVRRCRFDLQGGRIVAERSVGATGSLTVRGERIFAGSRVVLTRRDLVRAARRHPNIAGYDSAQPLRLRVTGLVRVGTDEIVVGLEIGPRYVEPQFLGALFRRRRLVTIAANFRGPYENLVVSPGGAFVASEDGTLFVRAGRSLDPQQGLPRGRAVAFSPDERWLAYVTGVSVYLVGTPANAEPGRIIRLPFPAQDFAWEPVSRG